MPTRRLPHRGSNGSMADFAGDFLQQRLKGFKKDMEICLTGVPSMDRPGMTHAYFPALMACCSILEYVTQLHDGKVARRSDADIAKYANHFLPQPDYDPETCRVLVDAFRHSLAHHGIATGIWIDKNPKFNGRRITWRVHADTRGRAIQVKPESGKLLADPPWPTPYTHRVHIHLGRLWRDIHASVMAPGGYREAVMTDPKLLRSFESCMKVLYPG